MSKRKTNNDDDWTPGRKRSKTTKNRRKIQKKKLNQTEKIPPLENFEAQVQDANQKKDCLGIGPIIPSLRLIKNYMSPPMINSNLSKRLVHCVEDDRDGECKPPRKNSECRCHKCLALFAMVKTKHHKIIALLEAGDGLLFQVLTDCPQFFDLTEMKVLDCGNIMVSFVKILKTAQDGKVCLPHVFFLPHRGFFFSKDLLLFLQKKIFFSLFFFFSYFQL